MIESCSFILVADKAAYFHRGIPPHGHQPPFQSAGARPTIPHSCIMGNVETHATGVTRELARVKTLQKCGQRNWLVLINDNNDIVQWM